MSLSLVIAPKEEPVLLGELKRYLRVDAADSDALLDALITTARQHLDGRDGWLGRALTTQTWDYTLDAFPSVIRLPLAPVQSVTSIKYLDTAGAEQTLASSEYRTDLVTEPARITPAYGKVWPSTYAVTNAVTVRFVAGWTRASEVPQPLRIGLMALVAHWFEHREPVLVGGGPAELPMHVQALLAPYRVWPVCG